MDALGLDPGAVRLVEYDARWPLLEDSPAGGRGRGDLRSVLRRAGGDAPAFDRPDSRLPAIVADAVFFYLAGILAVAILLPAWVCSFGIVPEYARSDIAVGVLPPNVCGRNRGYRPPPMGHAVPFDVGHLQLVGIFH